MDILKLDYSQFVRAYKRFLIDTGALHHYEPDGRVVIVYETDWVQILFVSDNLNSEGIKLVVEVSLPTWIQDLSLVGNAYRVSVNDDIPRLREVLTEQITHLEYLLKLSDFGFRLGIIAEEAFWIAWIPLEEPPSRELFAILTLPIDAGNAITANGNST